MLALALEHLHSNPIGVYGDVLEERGISVDRVRLDQLEPLPDWRDYDLLVVMGGGMSVHEEQAHPWLVDEKRVIQEAVGAGMPYFGVCLGSQLLASSLGARVYRGPEPELGVNPVFLCEEARRDPVFRAFPLDLEVFEWHVDDAIRLARHRRLGGSVRTLRSGDPSGGQAWRGRRSGSLIDVGEPRGGEEAAISHQASSCASRLGSPLPRHAPRHARGAHFRHFLAHVTLSTMRVSLNRAAVNGRVPRTAKTACSGRFLRDTMQLTTTAQP